MYDKTSLLQNYSSGDLQQHIQILLAYMTEQSKLLHEELCVFFLPVKYSGSTESSKLSAYL